MAKKSPRGAECGARFIVNLGGVTVGFRTVRFTRESEKPLGDCHTGEEEEEADCKPEFEAKVLLGNLRLWRPRVASWNLLCMHHRPLPTNAIHGCFGEGHTLLCNLRNIPNVR